MDLTLGALTVAALTGHDDEPCLFDGSVERSYREVRERVSRLAQAMAGAGMVRGSRVVVLAGNHPDVACFLAATFLAGVRGGSLAAKTSPEDALHALQASDAEFLCVTPEFEERALALAGQLPALRVYCLGAATTLTDLVAASDAFEARPLTAADVADQTPDDAVRIVFTGGTTGRSKVVQTSNRSNSWMTLIQLMEWDYPEAARVFVTTPISHSGKTMVLATWLRGGCLFLPDSSRFDPAAFVDFVEAHRITVTLLVPTMIYRLLELPREQDARLASLESIYYGASAISPDRLAEALERYGRKFVQFYGQAEAPLTVCVLKKDEHDPSVPGRLECCGRPVPWMEVELHDDQDRPVPDGEPGELVVRGPLLMDGYVGAPEENAAALANGWLHTGDIARREPGGFLKIVDRKKDMIITGGFNVYAREVEDVLTSHPAVVDAAVFGTPDPDWGEQVSAAVTVAPGVTVDERALQDHVRAAKGAVHVPKQIWVLDALPLTPVGKVDKKAVRAAVAGAVRLPSGASA
jgi:fatty-acyl-CoA synthase